MTIKEIRKELMTGTEVIFSVKNHRDKYRMICKHEDGENKAISNNMNQMNISKFGPTCMTLYTYDMMSNKTVGKIKYEDVTLISRVVLVDEKTNRHEVLEYDWNENDNL